MMERTQAKELKEKFTDEAFNFLCKIIADDNAYLIQTIIEDKKYQKQHALIDYPFVNQMAKYIKLYGYDVVDWTIQRIAGTACLTKTEDEEDE